MQLKSTAVRTTLAAAVAASAALGLGACGASSSSPQISTAADQVTHQAPPATATLPSVPGGSSAVALDAGFTGALQQLQLTPGVVGSATLANGSVSFPITGGTVTLYDKKTGYRPFVQGMLFHEGSGLSLAGGGKTVQLTNFVIDPGDPARIFGDVYLDGKQVAMNRPLFDLDGSTLKPITMDGNGAAVLTGTRVLVSPEAAQLLDSTFGTQAVKGGLLVGIATLTVNTK